MPAPTPPRLSVPAGWQNSIQAAILHVIALAQYALAYTRSWAADSSNQRLRLRGQVDQLEQEAALLREELRIKNSRMERIPAGQRPHYGPTERLAILELRAARGWSVNRTARVFQVTAATISSWMKRLDEQGPDALLRTPVPINKFPDFVGHIVQRLQTLCPLLGKVKIAQMLARAGLHLGVSTVGRVRRVHPHVPTQPPPSEPMPEARRVTAEGPNDVWHADFTVVPIMGGLWTSWLPFALSQCWPFCWWVAVVLDHYSRRVLGTATFKQQPTSRQVCAFLGRVITTIGAAPKYLVTDSGSQFTAAGFKRWCKRRGVRQRRGAVGKVGSIAVVERFIGTLKRSCTRVLTVVSLVKRAFQRELNFFVNWYNTERPHSTLSGATPDEVYFGRKPACRAPRFEPRAAWPRGSPCARPRTLVKGQPGARLELEVVFLAGRRHLPRIILKRVA